MTSTILTRSNARQIASGFASRFQQVLQEAAVVYRRISTRREVMQLNASQLRDIGLDPAQVSQEPAYQTDPRTMIDLMSMR